MCKYNWLYIIPEVKLVLPKYMFLMLNLAAGGVGGLYAFLWPVCLFLISLKSGFEPVQKIIHTIIPPHNISNWVLPKYSNKFRNAA